MIKHIAVLIIIFYSSCLMAKNVEQVSNCSVDTDGRMITGLTSSFNEKGMNKYIDLVVTPKLLPRR